MIPHPDLWRLELNPDPADAILPALADLQQAVLCEQAHEAMSIVNGLECRMPKAWVARNQVVPISQQKEHDESQACNSSTAGGSLLHAGRMLPQVPQMNAPNNLTLDVALTSALCEKQLPNYALKQVPRSDA